MAERGAPSARWTPSTPAFERNLLSSRPVKLKQQTARKSRAITTRPTVAGGTTPRTRIHSISGVTRLLSGRGKRPCAFCSPT